MIPRVPPAASAPVDSRPEYFIARISGSATFAMVAAVAIEEPQIEPNAAQASTAAIANPPRRWPMTALAARNRLRDSPPCEANAPISRNSGMTVRS